MNSTLTVRDLLLPGEPLDPAEVLAGHEYLHNPVTWVVSLRPYPPAFPRLRGGELALVSTEHLARLDPPTTLSDVIRQLVSRGAAGMAVRGEVDRPAIEAARAGGLPIVGLEPDAPMHDIEQAVMRVCALYQARREILPAEEPDAWLPDLLSGRIASQAEVHSLARRLGKRLAPQYAAVFLPMAPGGSDKGVPPALQSRLDAESRASGLAVLTQPWDDGLVLLVPQGAVEQILPEIEESLLPCGLGTERPLFEAHKSLHEAQIAAVSSTFLTGCKPVHYEQMGSDRLLVLLYKEHPEELSTFVEETLGPLLRRDADSPTPLLATLESFVMHGGKLRETASDIYVHRNTLAYRLDRAAEILGSDLKDPQVRMSIELALRALPLVRPLDGQGARGSGPA